MDSRAIPRHPRPLPLAAQIARQLRMNPTWPNVQTIRLAIESEAEHFGIDVVRMAAIIVECAREESFSGSGITFVADWKKREAYRNNSVDRFWFEDSRWRTKSAYWKFCEEQSA